MKTVITMLLMSILCISAYSQNDYYTGKTNIVGENVTYKCRHFGNIMFELTNTSNANISYQLKFIDGTPATIPSRSYSTFQDKSVVTSIIREVFTPTELQELSDSKSAKMAIFAKLNENGTLSEVKLNFFKSPAVLLIPPDRLFQLEQKITNSVKFNIDPDMLNGKRGSYNYLVTNFVIIFKDLSVH